MVRVRFLPVMRLSVCLSCRKGREEKEMSAFLSE